MNILLQRDGYLKGARPVQTSEPFLDYEDPNDDIAFEIVILQ
jgi:hypothetical protein